MSSIILQTATGLLRPLLLMFSVFLLLRGHQEPGGGFVGGLVAASAYVLHAIAYDVASARRILRVEPQLLIGAGLLLALGSSLVAVCGGKVFMTGRWVSLDLHLLGRLDIGTPVLFDMGVYAVVLGTTLMIFLSLREN